MEKETNKLERLIVEDYYAQLRKDFEVAKKPLEEFVKKYNLREAIRDKNVLLYNGSEGCYDLKNYDVIKEEIKEQAIEKHLKTIHEVKMKIEYLENY